PFKIKEYSVTPPAAGYALLRLLATGICGTDVHIHHGRLGQNTPLILGHEFIGEIVDINAGDPILSVGDRVIFNMASPCGKCKLCESGHSANCLAFEVAYDQNPEMPPHFFGGYGEYVYAKAGIGDGALIKLPDNVDYMAASMFPCAGPTIIHALKLGGIYQNKAAQIDTAVVQGSGPLGMFSALWLSLVGVKNIYTVVRDTGSQRSAQIKKLTRSAVITENELKVLAENGLSVDLVIECSGNPEAFNFGCAILRNRGIYLVPGQYSDSGNISFGPQIITFKALQVIGSSQYDASDVADYIAFLSENSGIMTDIGSGVKAFPLAEVNEAMDAAEKHLFTKVVLV
ncbi:MAG: alcohol dehydrogenase catalytic domain-containing protein, partial [Eubacteriales bacterium]|nr:alcohol dehydrogenase catalytic domain-containing protein [Eubacteriales bacterium]